MEALVLLMKKKTVLPATNGVNINGSETDGVSDKKRA